MTKHVLIVEDDEMTQMLLTAHMQSAGYKVSSVGSGKEMLAILDHENIDLILLDLGLPDEDGLSLTRQVKARSTTPIIILTARKDRADRLSALEMGAEDYLTKPFDPEELSLRVRNLLIRSHVDNARNSNNSGKDDFTFAGFTMNMSNRSLTREGKGETPLSRAEFNLLAALAMAANRVLSRDYLLDAVSHHGDSPSDRTIDVLISRLRKKLENDPRHPELIITVPGCGYRLSADVVRR